MAKKNVHVVPRAKGKWAVISEGSSKASKVTDTQKAAIDAAKQQAKNNESELIIHGRDNKFREKNSYGSDAYPPKG